MNLFNLLLRLEKNSPSDDTSVLSHFRPNFKTTEPDKKCKNFLQWVKYHQSKNKIRIQL